MRSSGAQDKPVGQMKNKKDGHSRKGYSSSGQNRNPSVVSDYFFIKQGETMYHYQNLESVSLRDISRCLNAAFSDYAIPVRLNEEELSGLFLASGIIWRCSSKHTGNIPISTIWIFRHEGVCCFQRKCLIREPTSRGGTIYCSLCFCFSKGRRYPPK